MMRKKKKKNFFGIFRDEDFSIFDLCDSFLQIIKEDYRLPRSLHNRSPVNTLVSE